MDKGKKDDKPDIYIDENGHWHLKIESKMNKSSKDGQKIIDELRAKKTPNANMTTPPPQNPNVAKNTKEAIAIETTRGRLRVQEIVAQESSKEVAGKHLAKAGAIYLLILVLAFIGSVTMLPNEAVAVVAGLITLVVTNLSTILKGIVETKEQKDPIELMYDIAEKNSDVCQEEHRETVQSAERAQKALVEASRDSQKELITSFERSQKEMVEMLRQAQAKQPTSLSIRPDDVVIKQGDNEVKTSTKNSNP